MERLIEVLKTVREDIDFKNTNNLVDGEVLESLDIVFIITAIEEEYGILIPPTEIVAKNFNSINAIWNMIDRLLSK